MPLDVNLVEALLYSVIRYSNDEWSALSASNFVMQQWYALQIHRHRNNSYLDRKYKIYF